MSLQCPNVWSNEAADVPTRVRGNIPIMTVERKGNSVWRKH